MTENKMTKQVKPKPNPKNDLLPNHENQGILNNGFMQLLLSYSKPCCIDTNLFTDYGELSKVVFGTNTKTIDEIIERCQQLCIENVKKKFPKIALILRNDPRQKTKVQNIIYAQIYHNESEKANIALNNIDKTEETDFVEILKGKFNQFLAPFITDPYERERKENIRRQQELDNPPTESYYEDTHEEQQGKYKILDYNALMAMYEFLEKEIGSNCSDIDFIQRIQNANLSGISKNKMAAIVHIIFQMGYVEKAKNWADDTATSVGFSKSICKQKFDTYYYRPNSWLKKMIREMGIDTTKLCA